MKLKLGYKIVLAFIVLIVVLGVVNVLTVSSILDDRMHKDLETTEVLFAKSISNRIFKQVIDGSSLAITDLLFDEKKLREEKIEYIAVFDKGGYLISHTYLTAMPKRVIKLNNEFGDEKDYNVEEINEGELFVYDVSVPVMEGIQQVGTVHVGYEGSYMQGIKNDLVNSSIIWTSIIGAIAIVFALILSYFIVSPLRKLTNAANMIAKGNLDVELPKIRTKDEIRDLSEALKGILAAVQFLTDEISESEKT